MTQGGRPSRSGRWALLSCRAERNHGTTRDVETGGADDALRDILEWTMTGVISVLALALAIAPAGARAPSGLAYSTASGHVVQRQPGAGSCHAVGRGLHSRPDPRCTPGTV